MTAIILAFSLLHPSISVDCDGATTVHARIVDLFVCPKHRSIVVCLGPRNAAPWCQTDWSLTW